MVCYGPVSLEIRSVCRISDELALPHGASVYVGFDPTADSLHVGNLMTIMVLLRLQRMGYQPIAVVMLYCKVFIIVYMCFKVKSVQRRVGPYLAKSEPKVGVALILGRVAYKFSGSPFLSQPIVYVMRDKILTLVLIEKRYLFLARLEADIAVTKCGSSVLLSSYSYLNLHECSMEVSLSIPCCRCLLHHILYNEHF